VPGWHLCSLFTALCPLELIKGLVREPFRSVRVRHVPPVADTRIPWHTWELFRRARYTSTDIKTSRRSLKFRYSSSQSSKPSTRFLKCFPPTPLSSELLQFSFSPHSQQRRQFPSRSVPTISIVIMSQSWMLPYYSGSSFTLSSTISIYCDFLR
jgi:hypothetical protein